MSSTHDTSIIPSGDDYKVKEGNDLNFNNQHLSKSVIIFSFILLLVGVTALMLHEINRDTQIHRAQMEISDKVTQIMNHFHCHNPEIHAAIMDTFDPILIAIVIGVESEYCVNAISRMGCRGLMQLTPDKLDDWKNVRKNIAVGSKYLKEQIDRFGNIELAIAAYNAGPAAVSKYKGIPPYQETKAYIEKTKLLSLAYNHTITWNTVRGNQLF